MNTLILEEEAQEAIELAEALPDRPDVLNASATLVRAYKAQQEKLGQPLFPQAERRKAEDFQRVRGYFTNRETYGLDDDTRAGVFRDLPDEEQRAALFSEEFLARVFQKPTKEVRALGPLLRDQYALEQWGEPVKTYKEFYDRQAAEFDFEDAVARKATAAALSNMGPLDAFADLETENATNALYTGRRKQWRDQFSEIAAAERDRLAPYIPTVRAVADILQAKTGTGGEGTEDESYRQLAGYLMEVPKEDREFVIAAIASAGANDEAGRKGAMKKLAESFGRGLVDYRENIPANLERGQVLAARRRIEAGLLVDSGSATPDGILGAALAQGGAVSDSMTAAPVPQNPVELSEEDKAQALALADELIDGIDLRAKLRGVAENDIDPISSEWMAMRGLYSVARSMPYTLAAIAPGGLVLNTLAMSESSYQQLRAANPDMTAGQAQAIANFSGRLQAGLERISGKVLTGRLPSFNRFANQVTVTRGAALGRFGARAGVSTGIEILQENAQDLAPFAVQGIASALNEDIPGIPWDVISEQFSAENQGELFFATLPLALFGAGVGTARDYVGVTSDVTNYDFLKIVLGSEAVAADVRSKYVNGDEKGAQAAMRARMQEIGADQKAYQEVQREAIPKYLAEREAMQKALDEAGELDILPAILRERDKWTLRYNSGENAQFDTYDEAFSRWESVASSSVAALHEDMISATRYAVAGMDRGREAKLIVSPFQPIAEDKIAEGVTTEEDIQQREEIAAADKPLAAKTEERRVKALANLAATSSESRKVASLILGESVNNVAPPDSFGDRVIRTTAKVYQGATPFTIIEEFAEGDAKYLIQEAGVPRAWFIDTLREWEKTTGDTLFRKSIKDPADIKNSDIIEAYSKMVVSYFAGKASKEENGLALSKGTRGMIAKALRGDLGAVLTGYAGMFEAIYRRSAMLDKARRDGTLDEDLEGFLAKSTGMSEQRVFEREVQREGEQLAEDVGATFSVLPGTDIDTEYMAAVEAGDMETARRMVDEAARGAGYDVGPVFHGGSFNADTDPVFRIPDGPKKKSKWQLGFGTHFAEDSEEAKAYLQKKGKFVTAFLSNKSVLDATNRPTADEGGTMENQYAPTEVIERFSGLTRKKLDDWISKYSNYPEGVGMDSVRGRMPWGVIANILDEVPPAEASRALRDAGYQAVKYEARANYGNKTYRPFAAYVVVGSPNQIKSADPVTYDGQGNVIPLSQRFNPSRDEITYSLLPDASNLDSEFARMFSPFQRSPELRMKLGQEMARRVAEQVQKLRPILRANRTKKSIEAERKTRQEELFSEKLDLLSPGEVQALSNGNLLEDNSLQPILSELLTEKTRKTKGGKTVRYWQGSLMSKSEAKRRGIDTTGGEWDAIPEGLPPYVWGGSITPDQAATMFGFDRPEMFFDALAGEIQARADRKAEIEAANRRVRELEREARDESRAWAEQAMKDRETVGSDRATLLGFLRTLDAITRALPAEVRGKIGGSVALAKLTTPAAMLDEIEARVEKVDRELERWMQKEATEQVEAFFEKVAKSKNSKAGEAAKGKKNLPEIYKVMALAEKAFKSMSAEEGQSEGLRLQGLVDSGAIADDDVAATLMAAELIPLFSGWNGKTRDEVIDGKTKRIRIASPSDSAQKTAALEAAKKIWTEGVLEWKTRQAEIKERRDSIRQQGEDDIAKASKLRTRDEREILDKGRASLPGKFALNLQSFDGFFRWHLGENSSVYKWITDSERKAANAYDDAVRNISKSVDDWFTKKAGSRFKGEKLRQKMAETYVELTPEKGEVRKLSQLQLITAQLIWRQEDGKRHMKGRRDDEGNIVSSWSYGDGFMAQVDAAMSEEARELMDFLSDAYDKEYEPLNKVYRKLFGIDLPKHLLYSPLTVKPEIKNDAGADPVTGFFSGGLSGISGALKTRGTSIVEPDFKDALQVYVAHSMQMEHFKAFAELARDARAIFGRVSFRDQIKRASGDEGVTILDGLLEVLDKGGIRSSGVYLESAKTLEKLTGRLSTMILFGKLQTIALNVTQLAAASVEMGPRTYWKQFAKLWFTPTDWAEALRTPYIQRRIEEMPPVIRQVIESNRKLGPSRLADINDKLGYGISASDGFFTAGTYAMVYDWKKQEAARLGVPAESVEEFARNETERIMDRLAQPTRKGARSIFENNMGAEGRALFNFVSESLKNMRLASYAAQKDRSKLAGTAQFVILSAVISTLIRAAWQDLRDDDEGEDATIWNPSKLALEIAIDPIYGIPVVGGMLQDAIKAGFGFKTFGGTILESGQSAIPAARRMVAMDYDADEIDRIAGDLNAILGAFGYFSRRAAALASITNVVEDALKVYDNLIGE